VRVYACACVSVCLVVFVLLLVSSCSTGTLVMALVWPPRVVRDMADVDRHLSIDLGWGLDNTSWCGRSLNPGTARVKI
jgi:hypothetical protein